MTKVINFIGGPGCGKSTMSGQLFGYMKEKRYNVEYVSEFAKQLAWDKAINTIDDQIYLLGVQNHGLYSLMGEADYIITDSPILLNITYGWKSLRKFNKDAVIPSFSALVRDIYYQYDNTLFYVDRKERHYSTSGRLESENEALTLDRHIKDMLDVYEIPYTEIEKFEQCLAILGV